jgi:ABC-type polysaccharide/polyol phosphate transport system ATPase subunit
MGYNAIEVSQIAKRFYLSQTRGVAPYLSLREVIAERATAALRRDNRAAERKEFWALDDVSFNVQEGECVGVIGRNGAGKSTLLKILSRITAPTRGAVTLRGRVASLLEVGTGFHPELTARENIYLNGAILGMSRAETKKRFDEIVDFAESEPFLDTPVKYYSSGMYVKLAFAVAAHLEPEILIVDEVLAVGDMHFQRKCMGKMQDACAKNGRTVLFVSHNMASVRALCTRAILLSSGRVTFDGSTEKAAKIYAQTDGDQGHRHTIDHFDNRISDLRLSAARLLVDGRTPESGPVDFESEISIEVDYEILKGGLENYTLDMALHYNQVYLGPIAEMAQNLERVMNREPPGSYTVKVTLPRILKKGSYSVDIRIGRIGHEPITLKEQALTFNVDVLSTNPRFQPAARVEDGILRIQAKREYSSRTSN